MESSCLFWLGPVEQHTTCPLLTLFAPEPGPGTLVLHTRHHADLLKLKREIEEIHPEGKWDDAKKITNPFEFIFLSLQKRMHRSVSALQPLSRSFFKMIELWDLLELGTPLHPVTATSHTAEGPGGFLEAIQYRAPRTASIAMTLRSTEKTIPGWRKSHTFLRENPTVAITYGADNTGNLYSLANQAAFAAAARKHFSSSTSSGTAATPPGSGTGADLYTADGGFDFSSDYNGQENSVLRLLAAEGLAGLTTLRPGGIMILKVFDTKNKGTLDLLWLLSMCFCNTAMVKPHTSRPANSERYFIGYMRRDTVAPWILDCLQSLVAMDAPLGWNTMFRSATPALFPPAWLEAITLMQERIELQQMMSIQTTLGILRDPSRSVILELLKLNVFLSRQWCETHGIPVNPRLSGLSVETIARQNLEEVMSPFQAEAGHTCSPAPFRQTPMRRVPISVRPPRPPTVLAWRSALPASIVGHRASQTVSDTPPGAE